jgi:hypothetical protein
VNDNNPILGDDDQTLRAKKLADEETIDESGFAGSTPEGPVSVDEMGGAFGKEPEEDQPQELESLEARAMAGITKPDEFDKE